MNRCLSCGKPLFVDEQQVCDDVCAAMRLDVQIIESRNKSTGANGPFHDVPGKRAMITFHQKDLDLLEMSGMNPFDGPCRITRTPENKRFAIPMEGNRKEYYQTKYLGAYQGRRSGLRERGGTVSMGVSDD